MTAPNMLDWIVALLVGWASLTAIFEAPRGATATQCDVPYATDRAPQVRLAAPTQVEIEGMIRDMQLHD